MQQKRATKPSTCDTETGSVWRQNAESSYIQNWNWSDKGSKEAFSSEAPSAHCPVHHTEMKRYFGHTAPAILVYFFCC